jgi:hypothetical protein
MKDALIFIKMLVWDFWREPKGTGLTVGRISTTSTEIVGGIHTESAEWADTVPNDKDAGEDDCPKFLRSLFSRG